MFTIGVEGIYFSLWVRCDRFVGWYGEEVGCKELQIVYISSIFILYLGTVGSTVLGGMPRQHKFYKYDIPIE